MFLTPYDLRFLKIRRTMRTFHGQNGYRRQAILAFLRGHLLRDGLPFHPVDILDEHEDAECHDQETDDGIEKKAVIYGDCTCRLGLS